MPTFTTLSPEVPVQFHARRWLLCDTPWDDLPPALRQNPWAAWRHRSGLLQCCTSAELSSRVSALLDKHPHAHLTVLAPGAAADQRYTQRNCAPDANGAHRVSIVFDVDAVLQMLTQPETECSEWLGRLGQVLLPVPLDELSPDHRGEWEDLMRVWIQSSLKSVVDEVTEDLKDELEGANEQETKAVNALTNARAKALAQLLHGLGEDDKTVDAIKIEEGWSGIAWGANDPSYQPTRLCAASAGSATELYIDELGTVLSVNLCYPTTHGALNVSFSTPPRFQLGVKLLRIDLFDKILPRNQNWSPLPLVIHPDADNPVGPWQIDGRTCPGLPERYDHWIINSALDVEVWVHTNC